MIHEKKKIDDTWYFLEYIFSVIYWNVALIDEYESHQSHLKSWMANFLNFMKIVLKMVYLSSISMRFHITVISF